MVLKILFTVVHVLVSIFLILVVLLQTGKRADLAGAFGGGGSQTAFGARGTATLLSKVTTICAATFMVTSLALVILARRGPSTSSVLDQVQTPAPVQQQAPPAGDDLPALPPVEEPTPAPAPAGGEGETAPAPAEGGN